MEETAIASHFPYSALSEKVVRKLTHVAIEERQALPDALSGSSRWSL
jgi:hypothetical protein